MLSYKFKFPGYLMILTGVVFALLYFTVKFRFELPVFAVFSSFLKTRYFTTFTTNFTDESIFLLLIAGFTLVVFSKERNEMDIFPSIRNRALIRAVIADISILIFSVLFIYGSGFAGIVLCNLFLPFILYLAFFHFMKYKETKTRNLNL